MEKFFVQNFDEEEKSGHTKNALKNQSVINKIVDPQGFEPQLTVPKTEVLPLHHGSFFILVVQI